MQFVVGLQHEHNLTNEVAAAEDCTHSRASEWAPSFRSDGEYTGKIGFWPHPGACCIGGNTLTIMKQSDKQMRLGQ